MFEPQQQHFVHLRENRSFAEDPNSWLSEEQRSSSSVSSNAPGNNGNVDRVLFKNLGEMVPLVESLMDRRANMSFTWWASMIYTRTPSRESYPKKIFGEDCETAEVYKARTKDIFVATIHGFNGLDDGCM